MINRFIMLENGIEVELPQELNVEERIVFCNELIEANYEDFQYDLPENDCKYNYMDRVKSRLDKLGYYLCELPNRLERDIITEKQEKTHEKHMKNGKNAKFYYESRDML